MNTSENSPKVAFFMPCYNHKNYIAEAMQSILNQTYSNWELYVADDGSTDGTKEVIKSFRDRRIHFYDFEKNTSFIGAFMFIQKEMEKGDFQYVNSMASDDMIECDKLEKQVAFMLEHPEYKACFTWDRLLIEKEDEEFPRDYSHLSNQSRYDWVRRFLERGNVMNACSCLMDRDVFFELGGMNVYFRSLGDFRLWFMAASKYPIYLMKEELTIYRRHDSNISIPSTEQVLGTVNEWSRIEYELVSNIDAEAFHRSFYPHLLYKRIHDEGELLAGKFYLLLSMGRARSEQAALWFFFDHVQDQAFLEALHDRFFFDYNEYVSFVRNSGLIFLINESTGENHLPRTNKKVYNSMVLMQRLISHKGAEKIDIADIRYSILSTLYDLTEKVQNGNETYVHFRDYLFRKRDEYLRDKNPKVLYLIANTSDYLTSENGRAQMEQQIQKGAELYVSFIGKMDILDEEETEQQLSKEFVERGIHRIDLWDEKNQSLLFGDEVLEEVTEVCFVDSFMDEYETLEMANGYSLGCRLTAVMTQDCYDRLLHGWEKYLGLLDCIWMK